MVTYLPTILINFINQATNYITGDDKYSMIITCMMMLASVYLAVSSSLKFKLDWFDNSLNFKFLKEKGNILDKK